MNWSTSFSTIIHFIILLLWDICFQGFPVFFFCLFFFPPFYVLQTMQKQTPTNMGYHLQIQLQGVDLLPVVNVGTFTHTHGYSAMRRREMCFPVQLFASNVILIIFKIVKYTEMHIERKCIVKYIVKNRTLILSMFMSRAWTLLPPQDLYAVSWSYP